MVEFKKGTVAWFYDDQIEAGDGVDVDAITEVVIEDPADLEDMAYVTSPRQGSPFWAYKADIFPSKKELARSLASGLSERIDSFQSQLLALYEMSQE